MYLIQFQKVYTHKKEQHWLDHIRRNFSQLRRQNNSCGGAQLVSKVLLILWRALAVHFNLRRCVPFALQKVPFRTRAHLRRGLHLKHNIRVIIQLADVININRLRCMVM